MSRNTKGSLSFVWMTVALAIAIGLSASVGWTQDADKPGDAADAAPKKADDKEPDPVDDKADVIKESKPGLFEEVHFDKVELRSALALLNRRVEKNIITTKEATGTVTASLYKVTFDEALEMIRDGRLIDAKSICGLSLAKLRRG